jgi:hypothetical protein
MEQVCVQSGHIIMSISSCAAQAPQLNVQPALNSRRAHPKLPTNHRGSNFHQLNKKCSHHCDDCHGVNLSYARLRSATVPFQYRQLVEQRLKIFKEQSNLPIGTSRTRPTRQRSKGLLDPTRRRCWRRFLKL